MLSVAVTCVYLKASVRFRMLMAQEEHFDGQLNHSSLIRFIRSGLLAYQPDHISYLSNIKLIWYVPMTCLFLFLILISNIGSYICM